MTSIVRVRSLNFVEDFERQSNEDDKEFAYRICGFLSRTHGFYVNGFWAKTNVLELTEATFADFYARHGEPSTTRVKEDHTTYSWCNEYRAVILLDFGSHRTTLTSLPPTKKDIGRRMTDFVDDDGEGRIYEVVPTMATVADFRRDYGKPNKRQKVEGAWAWIWECEGLTTFVIDHGTHRMAVASPRS